jgi:hypothetical protein
VSRKLDAWIAENVMGWFIVYCPSSKYGDYLGGSDPVRSRDIVPYYTADIKDAWDVAEKIQPTFKVRRLDDGCWCVSTLFDGSYFAESAPMAICLAAYGSKTGEGWEDLKNE